jgi:hypothetical protein
MNIRDSEDVKMRFGGHECDHGSAGASVLEEMMHEKTFVGEQEVERWR